MIAYPLAVLALGLAAAVLVLGINCRRLIASREVAIQERDAIQKAYYKLSDLYEASLDQIDQPKNAA